MTILIDQVSAQFRWTGTGTGAVVAATDGYTSGFALPGSGLDTLETGYEIVHTDPAFPTEREVGRGIWTNSTRTLTRTTIRFNGVTRARYPSATAVSFSAGTKLVTLVPDQEDFGALAQLSTVAAAQLTSQAFKTAKGRRVQRDLAAGAGTITPTEPIVELFGTAAGSFNLTLANGVDANERLEVVVTGSPGAFAIGLRDAAANTLVAAIEADTVYEFRWRSDTLTYNLAGVQHRTTRPFPPFDDTNALAKDPADPTRKVRIDAGAVATATTRTIIMGNRDVDLGLGGTFPELSHTHQASQVEVQDTPTEYSPAGTSAEDHFAAIDTKFGTIATGSDAAPALVTSSASPYALTTASQLHTNAVVESHQASVDFEVPAATPGKRAWRIMAKHDGCIVSVVGNVGSVNGVAGSSEQLVNGGEAIVEVDSNPGSAPVVFVRGDVILSAIQVAGPRTYDQEDHAQDFDLIAGAGTQTFGAISGFNDSFYVNISNGSGSGVSIAGLDATVTLQNPGICTVRKHRNGALWAFGNITGAAVTNGVAVLDAA